MRLITCSNKLDIRVSSQFKIKTSYNKKNEDRFNSLVDDDTSHMDNIRAEFSHNFEKNYEPLYPLLTLFEGKFEIGAKVL
jgi:hypothetical protein